MPSSRALVATMTQSRPSANARSACRRSSRPSELCETNVATPPRPQLGGELLDPRPAVAEDQPLLAPVQGRDDRGGVVQAADVVEHDLGLPARGPPGDGSRAAADRSRPRASASSSSSLPTVAERPIRWRSRPASRPIRWSSASRCQPRSSRAKAWTSSTTTARTPANSRSWRIEAGDQHRLQRLGRRQQAVGRLRQNPPLDRGRHVAVPDGGPAADQAVVALQPLLLVVEQGLDRADVEHGQPVPAARPGPGRSAGRRPPRSCRRRSGPGPAGCAPSRTAVDRQLLHRPQRPPAQGVDDLVLERRMQPVEGGHVRGPARCRRPMRGARVRPARRGSARRRRSSAGSGGGGRSRGAGRSGPGRRRPAS